MCDKMEFPETFDEFAEQYGFKDEKQIYTNGTELIPVFRVKQWLEHDEENWYKLIGESLDRVLHLKRGSKTVKEKKKTCAECKYYECFDKKEFPCIDCMLDCKDRFEPKE